jgi:peroxiredoxin
MHVEKLFIEPNFHQDSGPDPYEVSDAEVMMKYLKEHSHK